MTPPDVLGAVEASVARPELAALRVADPAERWEALGFTVSSAGGFVLGGVQVQFGNQGVGITGWSVRGIADVGEIDGLSTVPPPVRPPVPPPVPPSVPSGASAAAGPRHPNGAVGFDHVVVLTPDFDRTAAALERVGMPLRRIREVGGDPLDDPGAFRQGFRRLGPAILELVEARGAPDGPASFWGLVVIVSDLEALAGRLGSHLSSPKPAVQPGRRIATLRDSAGLSPQVAFMDPERQAGR